MAIKDYLKNPIIQQYVLEIALPLVGYLVFDWSIAVIIAFYFIDLFCSEIARHRRHFKILSHWNEKKSLFFAALTFSFFAFVGLSYFGLVQLGLNQSESEQIIELEEFFYSEGWFLIPIVYFANYMKDTMTFYAPRRFTKYNFQKTIKAYFLEMVVLSVLIIAGFMAWKKAEISEVPALLIFVSIKLIFDLLFVRRLKRYAQKV